MTDMRYNETELNRIREYINNNPAQWELDVVGAKNLSPIYLLQLHKL